ncbi:MAG TPA: HEAT repeat domain-containing protein [Planctomycetota bacterium]|nr:HEAT repeat domain-containing protein [Planctomycetota bacterium]
MTPLLAALLVLLQDDPDTELQSFQVADGYEVNLFASEKDGIVKPLQIRFDPRGRLWVTCGLSYPQLRPGEHADDTIVILEDTHGSGRADKSTTFARGLNMPMGLELGKGGAYVGENGQIIHLKEEGGKAGERTVLFKGFYAGDSHQNINSFTWGPGGELMFCQGLHVYAHVETPWGVEKLDKAGVWRMREKRGRLDPFLGDDMGPQNPYGVVFDDYGQPLVVAGNGQGVYYLLPAMIRTRHFQQLQQIWTKTNKLAGADLIETSAMPDNVQGVMVCGGFLNNAVYWFQILDDGSGFRVKDLPVLILSKSPAFRAVDVRMGPDGAIYIADWYNPIIGHYQASFRHPDRDKAHGRIWRVTAKGKSSVKAPNLSALSTPELLDQLKSPERWPRVQSRRVLADRPPEDVLPATSAWVETLDPAGPVYGRLLIDALGIYETFETVEPALLRRLLKSPDYRVRAYATRVVGSWKDRLPEALALLSERAADDHARVRLEAVVAAAGVPDPRAVEVASMVADRPMDPFLRHAFIQAVHALKPYWKPVFDSGQLTFGNRAERLQAVLKADGSRDVLAQLVLLLRSGKLSDETRGNALVLLASIGGPEELDLVLAEGFKPGQTSLSVRVLDELAQNARQRPAVPRGGAELVLRLAKEGDRALLPGALRLAGLWRVEDLHRTLALIAKSDDTPDLVRRVVLEALADFGDAESLKGIAGDAHTRGLAAIALSRLDLPAAAQRAATTMALDGREADPLVTAFLARQGGAEALAEALAAVRIPADTAKLGLRALSTAGRQDDALRTALSKAAGISSAAIEYNGELVKALGQEALSQGNPGNGEKVFRGTLTNCFSCHSIGSAGGKVGPDLSAVGTGLPIDMVVESVLWPNRQVKEGYNTTAVLTKNDQIFQGFHASEDKQVLILRDPAKDELIRIPIADIRARKEIGSVMPEGLTNGLTREELRDLIRFLADLGKPGPFRIPDKPLVRRWLVADAATLVKSSEEAAALPWLPRFATVAGELPLEDVPASGWVRFDVDVIKPGRFQLTFNNASGLGVWLDGARATVPQHDLKAGRHVVMLSVDRSEREGAGLRCQVDPSPGSAGELRLITDK